MEPRISRSLRSSAAFVMLPLCATAQMYHLSFHMRIAECAGCAALCDMLAKAGADLQLALRSGSGSSYAAALAPAIGGETRRHGCRCRGGGHAGAHWSRHRRDSGRNRAAVRRLAVTVAARGASLEDESGAGR